jgi:indole-3-glycerol phosphate synthase
MSTILDQIVAEKQCEIAEAKRRCPAVELEREIKNLPPPRDFEAALRRPRIQVIAEVKKASPSAGVIRPDFDPVKIAQVYERHGAVCISVLTDSPFFQGELHYLPLIRQAVAVPLLRKDFILDPYQLLQTRAAGADCALLIAEILPGEILAALLRQARELGLQVLVEFHEAEQLTRVVDSGATLIGINNRDLRTFQTRLEHTLELAGRIPHDRCLISESGIRTHADVQRLESAGIKAILVGETLMRAKDIGKQLDQLLGKSK